MGFCSPGPAPFQPQALGEVHCQLDVPRASEDPALSSGCFCSHLPSWVGDFSVGRGCSQVIGKASPAAHLDFNRRVQIQRCACSHLSLRIAPRALRMPMTLFLFLIKETPRVTQLVPEPVSKKRGLLAPVRLLIPKGRLSSLASPAHRLGGSLVSDLP